MSTLRILARCRPRRGGYTLLELMVANVMMGVLMLLVAGAWRAFGPLCVEVIARSRIACEANVLAVALDKDFSNHPYPWDTTPIVSDPSNHTLTLNYLNAGQPWTVVYTWVPSDDPTNRPQDGKITRSDPNGAITIARHVDSMTSSITSPSPASAELIVSLFYRKSRNQYTFDLVTQ